MAKRVAEKQLNYDNWDDPDEAEEAGSFEKADPETLKSRKIITARRISTQKSLPKPGLFKSFDAFGDADRSPTILSKPVVSESFVPNDVYLNKLSILNKEFVAWVTKHVSDDPYCVLTPIFADYSAHLAEIESSTGCKSNLSESSTEKPLVKVGVTSASSEFPSGSVPSATPFSFSAYSSDGDFAFKPTSLLDGQISKPPTFNFGLLSSKSAASTTSTLPFTFSAPSLKPPVEASIGSNDQDDDEYVPPKPEVREIKEDGSVFTNRCKLFYKDGENWSDRGLGNLHIIPSGEDKFQLLIRADTNLGNILLNIFVTKDIPIQVQKNNVTLACVPSPPLPVKKKDESDSCNRPIPMLIRVKTEEMAKTLLNAIDKHRGMA